MSDRSVHRTGWRGRLSAGLLLVLLAGLLALAVLYVRYTAFLERPLNVPEDGIWSFFLASDDGSRLYVGDELLIDNDGLHGTVERVGEIGLKAGYQPLRIEYFNAAGGRALALSWRGPKVSKQPIPADRVGHL